MTHRLVGVTGLRSPKVSGLRFTGHAVSEAVVDAIVRAGGTPVMIPPVQQSQGIDLSLFDAVVIPGGRDLDAVLYRGAESGQADADRLHDDVEIDVARQCIEIGVPLLAICRGLQVLNVALGGDLLQDLPMTEVPHREGFHDVDLEVDSLTARVMGSSLVAVSSYHHQAIDGLGLGLKVVGRARDGCIEAVEHESAPLLAVQWHPEDNAAQAAEQQGLFNAVVDGSLLGRTAAI